ncbi:hypothetical protein ACOSQ3_015864 [Xanthoceras sorbifolium]
MYLLPKVVRSLQRVDLVNVGWLLFMETNLFSLSDVDEYDTLLLLLLLNFVYLVFGVIPVLSAICAEHVFIA